MLFKSFIFTTLTAVTLTLSGCTTSPVQQEPADAPHVLAIGHASALRDIVYLKKVTPGWSWHTSPLSGRILDYQAKDIAQRSFYWVDFERSRDTVIRDVLKDLAARPQIIVMTARPTWNKYPSVIQQEILHLVKEGAVLALFGHDRDFFKATARDLRPTPFANPFAPVPEKDRFKFQAYQYGRGRIIEQPNYLDYRGGFAAPEVPGAGEFNYYMERCAQLLRTALNQTSCPVGRSEEIIFNENGQMISSLKNHPAGRYFCIKKQYDAGNNLLAVSGKCIQQSRKFQIVQLKRKSPVSLHSGAELELQIQWNQFSAGGVTEITLRDVHNRIYAIQKFSGTPSSVKIPVPDTSTSIYNIAQVSYSVGNCRHTEAETYFVLPELRRLQPFYFLAWGSTGDRVRHKHYARLLKAQGIDGISNVSVSENVMRNLTKNDLQCVPYTAAFHNRTIPWLLSGQEAEKRLKQAQKAAQLGRKYGILAHSLGDENYVSAFKKDGIFWDDPEAWRQFQNFLQQRYQTIDALNAAWKSSYPDFTAIHFVSERELFSFERPGAWVDYRRWISSLFIGEQLKLYQAIKKIDPGVFIGWEGGEQYSSYDGYDLYPYASQFDMANVYARSFMNKMLPNKMFNGHCIRSFAPRGALLGLWMNGAAYPNELYITPYAALFSGMRSIWWWHSVFPEEECAVLRHDMTPGIPFAETTRAVHEIKQGPAALLEQAVPESPQIAIYYSTTNFHASNLSSYMGNHVNNLGCFWTPWSQTPALKMGDAFAEQRAMWAQGRPAGHYNVAFKSFMTLVRDLNLDARVIDRRQIESGKLKSYKLLILPFVEALSDREVQQIRDFVKRGGSVVADYRTGVRDGNCNFRSSGALDEVFGIVQKAPFDVTYHPEKMFVENNMGDGRLGFDLPISFSQAQLQLKGGQSWGVTESGIHSFIFNRYGQGQALFFNCDFYQYFDLRRERREFAVLNYWRSLILRYLNLPLYQIVKTVDQVPVRALSIFHFRENEARYIGLIPERLIDEGATRIPAIVPLNQTGHWYDVLRGRYLGYGTQARVTLTRGLPALLAVLPQRVTAPRVTGPEVTAAGQRAEFQIDAGPGTHTLRVTVSNPEGRQCPHYGKFLHLSGKAKRLSVPMALNDAAGCWQLEVKDVASGQKSIFVWRLMERNPR